jgi:dTDP-4-amino-4,6-dideoxygalactose transaminase
MIRYEPVRLRDVMRPADAPGVDWWRPISGAEATSAMVFATGAHAIVASLMSIPGRGAVVVPAYTCDRVLSAVLAAADVPRFADVDAHSGALRLDGTGIDWSGVKAIILTHLFGIAPDRAAVLALAKAKGIAVVEDRAVTIEVPATGGPVPDYAIYSFGRGKPVSLGCGGLAVAFNERALQATDAAGESATRKAGAATLLGGALASGHAALTISRAVAMRRNVASVQSGITAGSLPWTDPAAAYTRAVRRLVARLDLPEIARIRANALEIYRDAFLAAGLQRLSDTIGARLPKPVVSPALVLKVGQRDRAVSALRRAGIDVPCYWQYALGEAAGAGEFPGARVLARRSLFLPLHSRVRREDAARVAKILRDYEVEAFS